MNDVLEFLKKYILKNGFEKLSKDPFAVYKSMNGIDPKLVRLVLITLMSKTHEMARNGCSDEELIHYIQSEHYVTKKIAKDLASMYLELFGDENRKTWNNANEAGFKEFCKKKWTVEWEGNCTWHAKHGQTYPCNARATLTFTIGNKDSFHKHLSSELRANPFLSSDEIYRILERQIEADLDNDMDEYCNADDYYEPFLDEFVGDGTYASQKKWESWGLKIAEFTGWGDVDFDP